MWEKEKYKILKILDNKTIKMLRERRIFTFEEQDGELFIVEYYDGCFAIKLTREMCKDFAEVFSRLEKVYAALEKEE